jgi:two-component system C4-dicarboxylate transport sensor histidine kinase DctB
VAGEDATERLAAIGEIAAEVAHELRNALQIISANVYLARQDLAKSEPHLAKIERNARIAHAIVDDLMALARGEPAHAEPILFAEVLIAAREGLPDPGAEFDDDIEPSSLMVRAHIGLLSRLFHVLYENAIGATAPRRPAVVTRARADGEKVVLDVSDDGPGVAAELAPRVFEPLVSAREGGTGLGLALARRIAAAHGGSIALVPSETGATFRVELPSAPPRVVP